MALIAGSNFWLLAAIARCSSRWSITGMTDAMLGVPPHEKNKVASLKIYEMIKNLRDEKIIITHLQEVTQLPDCFPFMGLYFVHT